MDTTTGGRDQTIQETARIQPSCHDRRADCRVRSERSLTELSRASYAFGSRDVRRRSTLALRCLGIGVRDSQPEVNLIE